jgi:hypothetical protein
LAKEEEEEEQQYYGRQDDFYFRKFRRPEPAAVSSGPPPLHAPVVYGTGNKVDCRQVTLTLSDAQIKQCFDNVFGPVSSISIHRTNKAGKPLPYGRGWVEFISSAHARAAERAGEVDLAGTLAKLQPYVHTAV